MRAADAARSGGVAAQPRMEKRVRRVQEGRLSSFARNWRASVSSYRAAAPVAQLDRASDFGS
jgi:hypothetical protein